MAQIKIISTFLNYYNLPDILFSSPHKQTKKQTNKRSCF